MKRVIILLIIIILSLILQASFLNYIKIFGVKPDLLIVLSIFFALYLNQKIAISLAVILGLLKDSLSIDHFGMSVIFFSLASYLLTKLNKKIYHDDMATEIFIVSIILVAIAIAKIFLLSFLENEIIVNFHILSVSFIEILYTLVFSPLIFLLLKRLL